MSTRLSTLLLATTALVPLGLAPANANPLGAQVVGGSAAVQGQGTAHVTVTQTTDKAIVNWNTFNIGAGERTQFVQPGSSSVALNRVTGGLGPSQIFGSLSANGRIFVVNPDGILIGTGAKIDTAGFLATTNDIANADFMAGRYNFSIPGRSDASIVNQGTITAQNSGFAALVAPGVRNTGTITARLGKIALASGNEFSLDFYGDKLITLGIGDSIAGSVKDVATGETLRSLVGNEGKLRANGGTVELTAVAARKIVDSVINNKGVIEANTIGHHNGMIVLGAATAKGKATDAPTQTVSVSGKLSATGKRKGRAGGTVQVTGEAITLTGATIDASGFGGGGTVLIGGDVGGGKSNPAIGSIVKATLQPYAVPTATTVLVDAPSSIDASAKTTGNGGKVVIWADGSTTFNGSISARGGSQSGDGGFVETSGHHQLAFTGTVDTAAPRGTSGTLLLDPQDVAIASSGAWIVTPTALQAALSSGDVIVTNASGAGSGDITVAESVNWSNANALTLNANRNIVVNANITNTGGAAVNLRADDTGTGVGTVSFGNGAKVSTPGAVSIYYNPSVNPAGSAVNPTSYVSPTEIYSGNVAGGGSLTAYMLVNSVNDLQNVQNNLSGVYALGKNIDASATSANPNIITFTHLGSSGAPFVGVFDGNGLVVDGLYANQGLFGEIGVGGVVRNIGITNSTALAIYGADSAVGLLAGRNDGSVNNSFAEGSVNANAGGARGGGLVGWNTGAITNSHAAVSVQGATGNGPDGGLVGFNDSTGTITQSYATGNVSGLVNSTPAVVGGFVGWNSGTITQSYSTGNVTGTFQGHVGGFAAINEGTITRSYAIGSVSGGSLDTVGGFVGYNNGHILESYSTGSATETSGSYLGGFVGYNDNGVYSDNYWDTQTSGAASASRNTFVAGGVTGLTTDQARQQASYSGWDFSNNWFLIEGQTRPFLRSEWSTTISNPHQLQLMAMNLSGNYKLGNDLDFASVLTVDVNGRYPGMWGESQFVPLGSLSNKFVGSLNGNLSTIRSITINYFPEYVGLFGYIGPNGSIYDLNLASLSITAPIGWNGVFGVLAGGNQGTISRVNVDGQISIPSSLYGLSTVGGLVGVNNGSISDSKADVSISATVLRALMGGLAGDNGGAISRSQSSGPLSITAQNCPNPNICLAGTGATVGGLVGQNGSASSISRSFSTSSVDSSVFNGGQSIVGGLIGSLASPDNVLESYATGHLSSSQNGIPNTFGGLVGIFTNFPPINSRNNYWDISATGAIGDTLPIGSRGLTTPEFMVALPPGFDPSAWSINASVNSGYPYLQLRATNTPSSASTQVLTGGPGPAGPSTTPTTIQPSLPIDITDVFDVGQIKNLTQPIDRMMADSRMAAINIVTPAAPSVTPVPNLRATSSLVPAGSPTSDGLSGPTSLVVTPDGNLAISNTMQWTGINVPLSAAKLLTDVQPFVAFADAAYNVPPENAWTQYAEKMGLSATDIFWIKNVFGFDAGIYKVGNKTIIAFKGSEDIKKDVRDWAFTNVPNGVASLLRKNGFDVAASSGERMEYIYATALAATVRAENPTSELYVTGHSLGGGLASYVGATLNISAITFNPEGISFTGSETHNDSRVINFQIGTDRAGLGGSLIGTTIVFDKALTSTLGASTNPITGPITNTVEDFLGLGGQHDLGNFIDLAYSSFSPKLTFTGSSASDQSGIISHTGPMFFVGLK